ncbi:MAG: hypothetical protein LW852_03585 [Sediminibacterium sp.]|jgi:hypothetical protein|nr:hypothetical protein [Sediminibacterium sp.]
MIKTFKLNITTPIQTYHQLQNDLTDLVLNSNSSTLKIELMRMEDPTPDYSVFVIEGEFPLYGKMLFTLCQEYKNLTFENYDIEKSIITNKVVIKTE